MGVQNSLAEEFISKALHCLLLDTEVNLGRRKSATARDLATLDIRGANEGMTFYTTTLANLGRSLDCSLAKGTKFVNSDFAGHGPIPHLFRDVWLRIFDCDGVLLKDPSVDAVRALRQVCYLAYKLELPYAESLKKKRLDIFVETDLTLAEDLSELSLGPVTSCVVERARYLLWRLFCDKELSPTGWRFDPRDITPRHGPGAVAGGERFHRKFRWTRFYPQLDKEYPYTEYFYLSYGHLCDRLTSYENLSDETFGVAKVALVPKDSRGPRLISMEPLEFQWLQQGLGRKMVDWIERHPLTRGVVNFTDQNVNRAEALASSLNHAYDTLDMKDASDRVSLGLVKAIFPEKLLACLLALRSDYTNLPDGRQVKLRKYAPMGSALCFPVESLVFWALATVILDASKPWGDPLYKGPRVKVYGDDLLIPHGFYQVLGPIFRELQLEFNDDKCCRGEFFRESCGMDAFRGEDVSPVRIRHYGTSPSHTLSLVANANAFQANRYPLTAKFIFDIVEKRVGPLPCAKPGLLQLSRHMHDETAAELLNLRLPVRYNLTWQRWEFRSLQPFAPSIRRGWSGWEELLRYFSEGGPQGSLFELYEERRQADNTWRRYLRGSRPSKQCEYQIPRVVRLRPTWSSFHQLGS